MRELLDNVVQVFARSGTAFLGLFPYVLVGVIAGELLKLTRLTAIIRRECSRALVISVGFAAAAGVVSPLCTYGTIPLMLQLLREGVPVAPLATFLSTSSLMNPQLFIMTMGGLGAEMALVRVGAVLLFGLLLGVGIHRLPLRLVVNAKAAATAPGEAAHSEERHPRAHGGGAHDPARPTLRSFAQGALRSLEFVGYYFVIGVLLGAVIEVFVPARWIFNVFSTGRWSSVLIATLLGVPLYACGGGAIPLIRSCIRQGMSKGAALAFLIIGPATRVTPVLSLTAMLRPASVALYVLSLFVFSIVAGLLYR